MVIIAVAKTGSINYPASVYDDLVSGYIGSIVGQEEQNNGRLLVCDAVASHWSLHLAAAHPLVNILFGVNAGINKLSELSAVSKT